jgi:hypothetical protein
VAAAALLTNETHNEGKLPGKMRNALSTGTWGSPTDLQVEINMLLLLLTVMAGCRTAPGMHSPGSWLP